MATRISDSVKPYKGPKPKEERCDAPYRHVDGVTCHLDWGSHPNKPHRGVSLDPFTVHEWGMG